MRYFFALKKVVPYPKMGLDFLIALWHNHIMLTVEMRRHPSTAGSKNARWNGGVFAYKDHSLMKKVRKALIEERGNKCEVCGETSEIPLQVHHLDKDKSNHNPENLVVVCHACHKSTFHSSILKKFGMSAKEIAEKLNLKLSSVYTYYSLGKLQSMIDKALNR